MATLPKVLDFITTQRSGVQGVAIRIDRKPNGNYSIQMITTDNTIKWTTWREDEDGK